MLHLNRVAELVESENSDALIQWWPLGLLFHFDFVSG